MSPWPACWRPPRRATWGWTLNDQKHEGFLSSADGALSITDEHTGIRIQTPLSRLKEMTVSSAGERLYPSCGGKYSALALTDDGKKLFGCLQGQRLQLISGSTVFDLSSPASAITLKLKP